MVVVLCVCAGAALWVVVLVDCVVVWAIAIPERVDAKTKLTAVTKSLLKVIEFSLSNPEAERRRRVTAILPATQVKWFEDSSMAKGCPGG